MHMQHQSYSRMNARFVGLLLGAMLLTSLAAGQSMPPQANSFLATGTYRLTVTERDLSLDAREASLAAILAEISQRTGIPIVVYSGMNERITIHLSPMPLDKALKQLAPNVAIATMKGPNAPPHRIAKVYVLPKVQDRPSQVAGNSTSPDISETRDAGGSVMASVAERPTPVATDDEGSTMASVAARPTPFQFSFDPSQHMKHTQ
jgi:ribosomal protein L25 (general stress protein Ctc)